MSLTAIAVLKWVRQYAIENYEKPKPRDNTAAVVMELDEIWYYLKLKKTSFGFGEHIVVLPLSSLTGDVGIEMAKLFMDVG